MKRPDPMSLMRDELARLEQQRDGLLKKVTAFRRRHSVTDEQCKAMIEALAQGRAKTIEEAYRLTR